MKLRARFTLWFSLAALLPIAAATAVTREVVARSYRAQFANEREALIERAKGVVASLEGEASQSVAALASPDNELVGGLLIELEKGGGELPGLERRRLVQRGGLLMSSLGLELLLVLDSREGVLASPHNPGLAGSIAQGWQERVTRAEGAPFYAVEPLVRGDVMQSKLVALAGKTVRRGEQSVTIAGGQLFDESSLSPLRDAHRQDARVVAATGEQVLGSVRSWDAGSSSIRVPLKDEGGVPIAWLEVSVSDAELAALLSQVTMSSIILGLLALFLTAILGVVVSRRMTRDLDRLAASAASVSMEELDQRIEVSSKGEIGALATAFNKMLGNLQESRERLATVERIAAWQEIARSLAHEIKNPLTPIQMSVETMRRTHESRHEKFTEIFEEATLTILEETGRLKRIVSEFSDFARMPGANKVVVDVEDVVQRTVSLYRGSVDVTLDCPETLPTIEADRDQLVQILLNLLENARDAISEGHVDAHIWLRVRLAMGGASIEIEVEDTGPGIAADDRHRIFTPYFTTKGQRGTGLGLATVHRIVTAHGGHIRVDEGSAGGARFVVTLPVATT